jgi:hypothetical protein
MTTNTAKKAQVELNILTKTVEEPIIAPFIPEILALCEKFGNSGQSGGSAPYTATALAQAIKKLCLQEPICPITGIEEEWVMVADELNKGKELYQNKRCSAIFKEGDGQAYYLDAIIKKTEKGHCYSGSFWLSREDYLNGDKSKKIGCKQYIKSFPFTPKTFYIDVIEEEIAPNDWEMYLKSPEQLEKVWKYYDKNA